MNSDQTTRPHRDQKQLNHPPPENAGATVRSAAEQVASTNQEHDGEDDGPVTPPEPIADEIAEARRFNQRRGQSFPPMDPGEQSTAQENLHG